MKRTPLYQEHLKLGANIVDFGGWEMPVQYTSIIEEHEKARTAAALFDVSHMGEISIKGEGAQDFLQRMLTNNIEFSSDNQVIYSPMCYPDGGVVDDLLVYKLDSEEFLLIVNASNTDKDYEWLVDHNDSNLEIINVSGEYAQLALQGPKAESILQRLTDTPLQEIKFFHHLPDVNIKGIKALVSRTGYTGEDGFEIYLEPSKAVEMWNILLDEGKDEGLVPAGLGARDTLRFEAALSLYGHEISAEISPLEAGLKRFVKTEKADFIGKAALKQQIEDGLKRKLVGFEMIGRGIPRNGYEVQVNGVRVGHVTSGSYSPSLKKNLGLALISSEYAEIGNTIDVVIRNKPIQACIIKIPFYSKKYKK
ncbi:MAG TPA: glycine cleavage system aminomethyltransferase GcvT [Clostridiaceae bacterium]|nr:glycine cleavage system aminomethyltransferase GcvT [Clostridiaceae bacterium]